MQSACRRDGAGEQVIWVGVARETLTFPDLTELPTTRKPDLNAPRSGHSKIFAIAQKRTPALGPKTDRKRGGMLTSGHQHDTYIHALCRRTTTLSAPLSPPCGSSCGIGRCRPDIIYETPDGTKGIIEIKTGNADLSIRQTAIFPQIQNGDAIPSGQVAQRFGLRPGIPLKDQGYPNGIPIEVREFPGARK